jgi:hypothetical protein
MPALTRAQKITFGEMQALADMEQLIGAAEGAGTSSCTRELE